ncbi:hypothetical protein RsS62_10190 [Rhizobium dioscoreae]|nr:hypothetical protein RsS62_10190 [Rhizobium dioscoreae]
MPLSITERRADFTNALKQAVFPYIDPGPDSFHQFLFTDNAPVIRDEEFQQFKGLWAQPDRGTVRPVKLGTIWIETESSKIKHLLPMILNCTI